MTYSKVNPRENLKIALFLAMNTGFVDAFTFFHFGERFASLQTGNLIQTGLNLAQGHFKAAFQFMIPVLFFIAGAIVKTLFTKYKKRKGGDEAQDLILIQMVGIAVFTLLFATVLQLPQAIFVGILSFFMVIQGDLFTRVHGLPYANIMSTGNIKSLATNFAEYLVERDKKYLQNSFLFFELVLSFVIGAFLSSFVGHWLGNFTLLGSSVLLLLAYFAYHKETKKAEIA